MFSRLQDVKEIYEHAELLSENLSLGRLGTQFWKQSNFESSICGPIVLEYPDSQYTSIEECNQPSWTTYLDACDTALIVALNNLDYTSLPRQRLRFSPVDTAISTLGSILALDSLEKQGIFRVGMEDNSANMTKLLLMALRTVPRLSYYLALDSFRLKEVDYDNLKMVEVNGAKLGRRWWDQRQMFSSLSGITNTERDFLNDIKVLQNTPYISKFYGVLIAFQLMEFYSDYLAEEQDIIRVIGKDDTFRKLIDDRLTLDWISSISIRYGFEISASAFINYFAPLDEYLDNAPLEQASIVTTTTTTTTTTVEKKFRENKETDNKQGFDKFDGSLRESANEVPIHKRQNHLLDNEGAKEPNDDGALETGSTTKVEHNKKEIGYHRTENTSQSYQNPNEYSNRSNKIAMWSVISVLIAVATTVVVAFVFTYVKKRKARRRTNNRRFDT